MPQSALEQKTLEDKAPSLRKPWSAPQLRRSDLAETNGAKGFIGAENTSPGTSSS